ncbi:MAG TPA: M23 family metallopeptidase [Candidatus Saccharimonadales bacterium]|nr:M23 family metallopeptidase [Candidatus Saccharimonadales bacterium]
MNGRLFFLAYKLPNLFVGLSILLACFFLLVFVQGCIKTASLTSGSPSSGSSVYYSNNPNAFAAGTDEFLHVLGQSLGGTWRVAKGGLLHAGASTVQAAKAVAAAARAVGKAIAAGCMWVVRTAAGVIVFVLQIPINFYGFISSTDAVNAVISPASHIHNEDVPIIDPDDPALRTAQQALPAAGLSSGANPEQAVWPMHGQITTYFGEKGRFYRTTHTGIDISDGQRSGVTPIYAFRSGKVILVERSSGLGNHVIIDHGNGITSVYGHMYSVAVKPGQDVNTATELGRQGTTGVSTGPHLHFEIRVNGQATDPRGFIAGHP